MLHTVSEPLFSKVFVTDELEARPVGRADFLKEKMALQDLAARLVGDPEGVLPRFVELAMQMTGGDAAGLSIFEPDGSVFRWMHLCGSLAAFEGATTPRDYSPCGITLDRRAPVLCRHPEWAYDWVADAKIALPEVLLVPLFVAGEDPIGTLWIASQEDGHFNSGHSRIAAELATFVGIALHVKRGEERLRQALEAQEMLTREMNHRLKNLFALTDGMLRQTMRSSVTKEEMAESLSGRLHALSTAYSLVLRQGSQAGILNLEELAMAVVSPHVDDPARFGLDCPRLSCKEATASSIALVLNELSTNAAKYGALSGDNGRVSLSWSGDDQDVRFRWVELGGPTVEAPGNLGFGSRLIEATIVRQCRGTFAYDWQPEGLVVAFSLPRVLFES
ncbi:sensor histidine kinase protein (plasmid) [Rhizobium phaseoli]|uniref:HWE histidine kinase domain-containing protein n=1 Tax=Rhizobium phaseoli TaxID=396 RepID=UPI0007EACBD9|nr:HWE histidine kinase domain-containing protein [Rhizobium phaseoli]ANL75713.1 sensor histidine kinase protein [Rhizobium phaseoli]